MPSTVAAMTGLTYAGTDLQDFPRIFMRIVEGGPDQTPEIRGDDRLVPYRTGRYFGPKRFDRLPILLQGWVSGEGDDEATARSDTAAARQELRAIFDPTLGEQTLAVTTEDGTEWTIEAYTEAFIPEAEASVAVPTHWGVMARLIAVGGDDGTFWTTGS